MVDMFSGQARAGVTPESEYLMWLYSILNHMCKTIDEPYGFNILMPLYLSNRPIQKDGGQARNGPSSVHMTRNQRPPGPVQYSTVQ